MNRRGLIGRAVGAIASLFGVKAKADCQLPPCETCGQPAEFQATDLREVEPSYDEETGLSWERWVRVGIHRYCEKHVRDSVTMKLPKLPCGCRGPERPALEHERGCPARVSFYGGEYRWGYVSAEKGFDRSGTHEKNGVTYRWDNDALTWKPVDVNSSHWVWSFRRERWEYANLTNLAEFHEDYSSLKERST